MPPAGKPAAADAVAPPRPRRLFRGDGGCRSVIHPTSPRRVDNAKLVHQGARCGKIRKGARGRHAVDLRSRAAQQASPRRPRLSRRHAHVVGFAALVDGGAASTLRVRVGWTTRSLSTKAAAAARSRESRPRMACSLERVTRLHTSALSVSRRWWMEERHPPYDLSRQGSSWPVRPYPSQVKAAAADSFQVLQIGAFQRDVRGSDPAGGGHIKRGRKPSVSRQGRMP
jgi:hypothetical protein